MSEKRGRGRPSTEPNIDLARFLGDFEAYKCQYLNTRNAYLFGRMIVRSIQHVVGKKFKIRPLETSLRGDHVKEKVQIGPFVQVYEDIGKKVVKEGFLEPPKNPRVSHTQCRHRWDVCGGFRLCKICGKTEDTPFVDDGEEAIIEDLIKPVYSGTVEIQLHLYYDPPRIRMKLATGKFKDVRLRCPICGEIVGCELRNNERWIDRYNLFCCNNCFGPWKVEEIEAWWRRTTLQT